MFYKLGCSAKPRRWLDRDDFMARGYKKLGVKWFRGTPFDVDIPNPMHLRFKPKEDGNPDHADFIPPYIEGCSCEFFRDDLIAALQAYGVDNLDTYPVTIFDPDTGQTHTNFKAVNIIGLVSAADMEKSTYTLSDGIPLIDVPFDELVLRTDEISDLLIFRLAENIGTILVHESIRKMLIEKGFIKGEYMDAIEFYTMEEAAFL